MNKKMKKEIWKCVFGILWLTFAFLCYFAATWYTDAYGSIGFDAILYTLTSSLGGVDTHLVFQFLNYMKSNIVFLLACIIVLFFTGKRTIYVRLFDKVDLRIYPFSKTFALILAIIISIPLLAQAANKTEFMTFVSNLGNPATLYEEEYHDPADVEITFPEEKRNLIYIYLESMEITFFSTEEGGALSYNVIPELYQLAKGNINFSNNDQVGGFLTAPGTTWTIGAIVGQTAGIPLKTPIGVDSNSYGGNNVFLPGVTGITNILHESGYSQAVMFGSDAGFGGRQQYFSSHGVDWIYDLETAWTDGIVPMGYDNDFWGMEDIYLYQYAKQKLIEMAAGEKPFAFSLLTVDTHHIGGYVCAACGNAYSEQYENVYSCASKQVAEFVQWIQQQEFYENTTIVIVGDHPSMDGDYMSRNVQNEEIRRVYNCIINSAVDAENSKNREFSTLDMFPTTLGAMGCMIEGNRLGLGTNLFSDEPTLLEIMGRETFESEISRSSKYYVQNFY